MKIVVCIKQVPDTKGGVKFNPDGTLDRAAMLTIMNPDDKAGLEAALRLKDQYGAEVTVITMGLPKAEEVLREAMAMGADKGILVTDRVLGGADTWATSQTLAGAIRNLEYDLIITGRQAIDGDTAQVGPEMAEFLGIEHIANVEMVLEAEGNELTVLENQENCQRQLKLFMPCLLTIEKDANTPRLPSYKRKMKTGGLEIERIGLSDFSDKDRRHYGLEGSPTQVERIFPPERNASCQKYEGEPEKLGNLFYQVLLEKKFVSENKV